MSRVLRMKINVFTPLPPEATEIANVNVPILLELARHADIVAWTPQDMWTPLPDDTIVVRSFRADAISYADLNEADANIFHIGNNVFFHQDIYDLCQVVPGIVVIHDVNLHHLLLGLHHTMDRRQSYLSAIDRCHGNDGRNRAEAALATGRSIDLIDALPATLAPATRANALVLHNQEAAETLRRMTEIPVSVLRLAFSGEEWPPTSPTRRTRPPYRLILFGFLSSNRGVDTILRVLAESSVRGWFTLDIYGAHHDPDALASQIQRLGLAGRVRTPGFVAVEELAQALDEADLVLNLRNPTVGEASASQLRIWAHGLPSIVTRIGWYGQQPETCCDFIDPGSEAADLHHALIDFCCNPDRWRRMGAAGRDHVHRNHGATQYAQDLLDIVRKRHPRVIARLSRDLACRLQSGAAPAGRSLQQAFGVSTGHLFDDLRGASLDNQAGSHGNA